jgi:hypothetical protein
MSTVQTDTEDAHSSWARIAVSWSSYETGENVYSSTYLSQIASCIQTLHSYGKSVLVTFLDTPGWAQTGTSQFDPPNNATTCPSEACYGAAAAHLVSDTSIKNAGGINALEVWNEEDTSSFWTGTQGQYETLLAGAYSSLQGLTTVVLGGTANINEPWHENLLNAGYGSDFDVLGIHTYPYYHTTTDIPKIMDGSTSSPPNTLGQIVKDLNNHGFTSTPIWITEMGALAPDWITDDQNAQMLSDFYNYIRGNPGSVRNFV